MTKIISIAISSSIVGNWADAQTNLSESFSQLVLANIESHKGIKDLSKSLVPSNIDVLNEALKSIYNSCVVNSNNMVHVQDIYDDVASRLKISKEARDITSEKTGDKVFEKRVRFALLKLKNDGFITNPKRGFYGIDHIGKVAIQNNITFDDLALTSKAKYIHDKLMLESTIS